jgi:hypothetical protein
MSTFEWVMLGLLTLISVGGMCIASVLAYRGFLGEGLFRWTRYPFAWIGIRVAVFGGLILSVGMNGVPAVRSENEDDEITEQVESNEHEIEQPSNDDNQRVKEYWSMIGRTPTDIRIECASKATSSFNEDEEMESWDFSQHPRESMEDFVARRKYEKAS